jgi:hypothetical protein
MKKVAGNGGSRLGQSSPVSAVTGEVREKKKIKKKKIKNQVCVCEVREKKKKTGTCVGYFDFILNLFIFLKRMRYQFMIRG